MKELQCNFSKKPIPFNSEVSFLLLKKVKHNNMVVYKPKTIFFNGILKSEKCMEVTDDFVLNRILTKLDIKLKSLLKYSFNFEHKNIYYNKHILHDFFIPELLSHKNKLNNELINKLGFIQKIISLEPNIQKLQTDKRYVEKIFEKNIAGEICRLNVTFETDLEENVLESNDFSKVLKLDVTYGSKSFSYKSSKIGLGNISLEEFLLKLSELVGTYVGLINPEKYELIVELLSYKLLIIPKYLLDGITNFKFEYFADKICEDKPKYEAIFRNLLLDFDEIYGIAFNVEVADFKDLIKLIAFLDFVNSTDFDITPNKFVKVKNNEDYFKVLHKVIGENL